MYHTKSKTLIKGKLWGRGRKKYGPSILSAQFFYKLDDMKPTDNLIGMD